jgi:hypothetical protein
MSGESFDKREREKKRQARATEKRERRAGKREPDAESAPLDTDALMEQFRLVSERHARGELDDDTFEAERNAILEALGLN